MLVQVVKSKSRKTFPSLGSVKGASFPKENLNVSRPAPKIADAPSPFPPISVVQHLLHPTGRPLHPDGSHLLRPDRRYPFRSKAVERRTLRSEGAVEDRRRLGQSFAFRRKSPTRSDSVLPSFGPLPYKRKLNFVDLRSALQHLDFVRTWLSCRPRWCLIVLISLQSTHTESDRVSRQSRALDRPDRSRRVVSQLWRLQSQRDELVRSATFRQRSCFQLAYQQVLAYTTGGIRYRYLFLGHRGNKSRLVGLKRTGRTTGWIRLLIKPRSWTTVACPTMHWTARNPFDVNRSLWNSFAVIGPRHRFFHVGDTGYCPVFSSIGDLYGPFDLAAIPIGAYEPRWHLRPQHIGPDEAIKIMQDLRATKSVAVHWGTWILSNERWDEPPKELKRQLQQQGIEEDKFAVVPSGKTFVFGR